MSIVLIQAGCWCIGLVLGGCERAQTNPEPLPSADVVPSTSAQVLLQLPPTNRKPPLPYHVETTANVIATATMGAATQAGSRAVVRLQIDRILLGQLEERIVSSPDELPSFACIKPVHPTSASSLFSPGTRVVAFLRRTGEGFALMRLDPLQPTGVDPWLLRFTALWRSRLAGAPPSVYLSLLENETWQPDSAAMVALGGSYGGLDAAKTGQEPNAKAAVLEHIARCRRSPNEDWVSVTDRLARLSSLLSFAERHRAIVPTLDCIEGAPAEAASDAARRAGWSSLDRALEGSTRAATQQELARLRAYAARRHRAGAALNIPPKTKP